MKSPYQLTSGRTIKLHGLPIVTVQRYETESRRHNIGPTATDEFAAILVRSVNFFNWLADRHPETWSTLRAQFEHETGER